MGQAHNGSPEGCYFLDNILQAVNLPLESTLIYFFSILRVYFEHRKCPGGQRAQLLPRSCIKARGTHVNRLEILNRQLAESLFKCSLHFPRWSTTFFCFSIWKIEMIWRVVGVALICTETHWILQGSSRAWSGESSQEDALGDLRIRESNINSFLPILTSGWWLSLQYVIGILVALFSTESREYKHGRIAACEN